MISATYRLPSGTMLTIRIAYSLPAGDDVLREAARVLTPAGAELVHVRFLKRSRYGVD